MTPTLEDQAVRAALRAEQLSNAQRTHLIRFVAVTFFFGLFLAPIATAVLLHKNARDNELSGPRP